MQKRLFNPLHNIKFINKIMILAEKKLFID